MHERLFQQEYESGCASVSGSINLGVEIAVGADIGSVGWGLGDFCSDNETIMKGGESI